MYIFKHKAKLFFMTIGTCAIFLIALFFLCCAIMTFTVGGLPVLVSFVFIALVGLLVWLAIRLIKSYRKHKAEKIYSNYEISQWFEAAKECVDIVNTTIRPEQFTVEYERLIYYLAKMASVEKCAKFTGSMPSTELNKVINSREEHTIDFINFSYEEMLENAHQQNNLTLKNQVVDTYFGSIELFIKKISPETLADLKNRCDKQKEEWRTDEVINDTSTAVQHFLDRGAASVSILDVSEIETTKIVTNESRYTTYPQNNSWIQQLRIPYERSVMQNKQIKKETLRLYNELCSYIDNHLNNEKKSLKREVRRVASKGRHYDNLLYTFYCIAEEHVTKGYGGHYRYDYEYSYGILENYLGTKIKDMTYQKTLELEDSLGFPSPETQREFYLTANGLPIVWWDKDGVFRAGTSLDKQNISILNATPSRDTKIWNLFDVKKEMLLLYLNLWRMIRTNLDKGLKWKKTSIANIEKIVQGKYSYNDYDERTVNFLSAFVKIAESAVRDLLPKSAYTQSLNLENDWYLVKLFLPKEIAEDVIAYLSSYKDNITQEAMYVLVSALADSEAANPRIITEKLRLSTSEQWLGVFVAQQDKSDYAKFLREIIKVSENNDLLLLASYELARIDKVPLAALKKARQIICKENIGAFESLIAQKEPLSASLLNQLLEFKIPIRKRIRLDSAQIEQSKKELAQTVEILSEFIPEEELSVPPEKNVTVVPVEEETSVHEDSPFAFEVEEMLIRILENGFIPSDEVKKIALTQGKLLGTYVSDLNKEFYEYVGDQLLLVDEDTVKIDDFYINLARELLNHEN